MSDTETTMIKATAKRFFKDAGTERNFTAGKSYDLTEGEFENFAAAGLVEASPVETVAADTDGKPADTDASGTDGKPTRTRS